MPHFRMLELPLAGFSFTALGQFSWVLDASSCILVSMLKRGLFRARTKILLATNEREKDDVLENKYIVSWPIHTLLVARL